MLHLTEAVPGGVEAPPGPCRRAAAAPLAQRPAASRPEGGRRADRRRPSARPPRAAPRRRGSACADPAHGSRPGPRPTRRHGACARSRPAPRPLPVAVPDPGAGTALCAGASNAPARPAAAGAAMSSAGGSAPAKAEIARQRPAGAVGEAVFATAAAAAAPVLLSRATAERVRTILVEGTSPATSRAHAGDVAYFWAWAGAELGLAEGYPVPPAALVQLVLGHLGGP